MKKLSIAFLTSKYMILTEVFVFLYIALLWMGFGMNGELSPSAPNLLAIVVCGILMVVFATKASNVYEQEKDK